MENTMEISNRRELIQYIRLMLGEPLIKVEITDLHINQVINDTLKTYTDVVYGFFEATELLNIQFSGDQKIRLLGWHEVTKVVSSCGRNSQNFKWDSIKRTLTLDPDTFGEVIVVGEKAYDVDEEFDLIFNESWVKEMATAKSQLLWGKTLGKYSQSLVGGAEINYDRIISEAQTEIDRLNEELQEKWVDPAPVLVG